MKVPFSRKSLAAWFLADGYLYDWIAAIVLIIINHVVPPKIEPVNRFYLPGDFRLSFPKKINTISTPVLYVITFLYPALLVIITGFIRKSFADGHHGLLSLCEGFALACGWKRWMNLVGRHRPNWLATLASTDDPSLLRDGREAYPSGHATYVFFSGTILALFLLGKSKVLSSPSKAQFLKLLLCLTPLWLSTFVAMTRATDYKHDFSDVNAGCFVGLATGMIGYFLNYPSLFSVDCHIPRLRVQTSALTLTPTMVAAAEEAGYQTMENQSIPGTPLNV